MGHPSHPDPAPDHLDYLTFDHWAGEEPVTVIASYQRLDGQDVVEIIEAIDEWGQDHTLTLQPHQAEDIRRTALSLFQYRKENMV